MPDGSGFVCRVRRVRAGEWQAVRELRLRALTTDPLAFGSTLAREQAFTDSIWITRTEQGATSASSSQWVAAVEPDRLIGMAVVAEVEGAVHLFAMWVEPAHRGRGVGAQLLDAALTWATSAHPHRPLLLEVNPKQLAAVHLYESRGFRVTGVRNPLGHTSGEEVAEMVLDIP